MSNLAYASRGLVRTPSLTLITVLILALGVGANAAIFSVVDAAMLKPMPIPEPARIVRLTHGHPQSFVWFNPRGFEVCRHQLLGAPAHARDWDTHSHGCNDWRRSDQRPSQRRGALFAGVVLGGLLALGASQILSSRVRDFGDLDFVTLSSVSSAFLVAAAIAAWIPARRATRIAPVQALRFE